MRSSRLRKGRRGVHALESEGNVSRFLVVLGLVILATGLLWPFLTKLGLGRLPGDIVVERGNFTFYFPLATSLIVSIAITFLFWLLNR